MDKTRFNGLHPASPVNALIEEPTMKGRSQGKGRRRSRDKGRGRVALTVKEVWIDNIPVTNNPQVHNYEI